jgi:hypothetical protein
MKPLVRVELAVVLLTLALGMLAFLLHSSTLEFFAVVGGGVATGLVVARALLAP